MRRASVFKAPITLLESFLLVDAFVWITSSCIERWDARFSVKAPSLRRLGKGSGRAYERGRFILAFPVPVGAGLAIRHI